MTEKLLRTQKGNPYHTLHFKLKERTDLIHRILSWYYFNNNQHFFSFKESTSLAKHEHLTSSKKKILDHINTESNKNYRMISTTSLDDLKQEVEDFQGCALKKTATNFCL